MDIHRWLQTTADREPPEDPLAPPRPDFAIEAENVDEPERRYRHKRKQYCTDSSIIAPLIREAPDHDRDVVYGRRRKSDRERRERENVSRARSRGPQQPSEAESQSARASPEPVTKTYERQPRHKTKADRYEPKKKKSKKDRPTGGEDAPKSHRRRSHRSGDGTRTAELVQSFQLKNGVKSGRLTLKTDGNAGLFNHGRASTQLPGKNSGLPDLVFNEMRFLQRTKGSAENIVDTESRKLSKQEAKRQIENGEISDYFDALTAGPRKQSAVASMHVENPVSKDPASTLLSNPRAKAPQPGELSVRSIKRPTSNRPAAHHADRPNHSTSCFTWSQSDPRPPPRQRIGAISGMQEAHDPEGRGLHDDDDYGISTKPVPNVHALQPPVDLPNRGTRMESDRASADLHVEVYKPLVEAGPARRHRTDSRTSVSLPRLPERPLEPSIRLAAAHSTSAGLSTPDILRLRSRMRALAENQETQLADTRDLPSGKENLEPGSTSPTAKLLRTAKEALGEAQMLQPYICAAKVGMVTSADREIFRMPRPECKTFEPNDTYLENQEASKQPNNARRFRHGVHGSWSPCRPPTGVAFGQRMRVPDHRIWGAPQSEATSRKIDDDDQMLDDQPDRYLQDRFNPINLDLLQQIPTSIFAPSVPGGDATIPLQSARAASAIFQDPPSRQSNDRSIYGQSLWSPSEDLEYSSGHNSRPSVSQGVDPRLHSGHGAQAGSTRSFIPVPLIPTSESSATASLHRIWGRNTLH
ncbi:hypothetical protein LTR95_011628 [Oleoguttula sp. CCFEE 5521]